MKATVFNRIILILALLLTGGANTVVRAQTLASPVGSSNDSSAKTAHEASLRGEELRRKWELDSAEAAFREAITVAPANAEAALGLARIARARFNYKEALRWLDQAIAHNPASADLLAETGWVYLAAEEPARALVYLDMSLKANPSCVAAILGRANAALLQRDYSGAELLLRRYLARNPKTSGALSLLGRVLLEYNKNSEAIAAAAQAIELDPFNTEALYVMAFARATERKVSEVRDLVKRVLALNPLSAGARRLLSQYSNGRKGYEQKVPEEGRKHYERGKSLKQKGRLREAVSEFEAALSVEPGYYRALISLGDIWLRERDYERAAMAARLALEVDPEGALAHLELSYADWGLQERARIEVGATDFAALFYEHASPTVAEMTDEIFPNYNSLTRRQQIVIDRAIAPLGKFLPVLARRGARHYLLPFDQSIDDIETDGAIGDKTFDGRYYASIRGIGGRITASGIEYIELAAAGGFNTIAHEFAHQVHVIALGRDERENIQKLYKQALAEGRALDYYAAENEFEYFAQGYEAFISGHKRPGASVTARHTRSELLARDPALYDFLDKLTGNARRAALSQMPSQKANRFYERARLQSVREGMLSDRFHIDPAIIRGVCVHAGDRVYSFKNLRAEGFLFRRPHVLRVVENGPAHISRDA
ncbi:MAG: tetratricopeptide repeat protein [Blastocatellia bacterium]|nr:tetratricopeptide repeat protein [Blastocatellia bacterium]